MSDAARSTMAATLAVTITANLPAFLVGGLAVQMQDDLGFGAGELGLALSGFFAAGALTSPLTGRLSVRFGAERSLRWSAFLSALVQATIATAARSIVVVMGVLVVGGMANAWAQPASNALLHQTVAPNRLGFALGLQKSAIPAGAMLGGLAVPTIALTVGWRWAFAAGAAAAVASIFTVPPPSTPPQRSRATAARPDVAVAHLALLAVGVGFGSAASNSLSGFLVVSGVEVGLGPAVAGVMLTIGSIAGIAVRLAIGARADRYPGNPLTVMATMFAVAAGSFLLLAAGSSGAFVAGTVAAFATAYAWPGLFHLAVVRANPSAPAAATGIAMTGTLAGAVIGPLVFGTIVESGHFGAAWITGAAFLAVAALIVMAVRPWIHEPDGTHQPQPSPH